MTKHTHHSLALLSVKQMQAADAFAIAHKRTGKQLMETAGKGIAHVVMQHYRKMSVLVLAGPGNNGGDGFIAAHHLASKGWKVQVALSGKKSDLKGDAAWAAKRYTGKVVPLSTDLVKDGQLIIDALFGSGLTREIDGIEREVLETVAAKKLPVVAADIPSGVDGDSGRILGTAVQAEHTVTFHQQKIGHLLLPGRDLCGHLHIVDIGIPDGWETQETLQVFQNTPELWHDSFPWPGNATHKYQRGHCIVVGGDVSHTGAARLSAIAALRIGAGLVNITCDRESLPIYATSPMAALTSVIEDAESFDKLLVDERRNTCIIGPGTGIGERTRQFVLAALGARKACVIDADGLTAFAKNPDMLFSAIATPCIMTPHDGEFARLFGKSGLDMRHNKVELAQKAAKLSHAVIILKGSDTVIASHDGRAAVNFNAPPWLATAGSGDVLAGMCGGLLAQGMDAFEAACAAVWMHGEAAELHGLGLIADDLPAMLPFVLQSLHGAEEEF